MEEDLFNLNYVIDCGSLIYSGPFFISDDHGCAHGPTDHGAAIIGNACIGKFGRTLAERRSRIFTTNMARLARADWVFAYIERSDCYGTLVELGAPHARYTPIAIGLSPELRGQDELWMAQQTASCPVWMGSATQCWQVFCRDFLAPQ